MIEHLLKERLIPAVGMKGAAESTGFGHGHPAIERMALCQIGDAAFLSGRQGGKLVAQQFNPAVTGLEHAQQHLDRGRLAGAIAPRKP